MITFSLDKVVLHNLRNVYVKLRANAWNNQNALEFRGQVLQVYLENMIDTSILKVTLESVLVVREFSDVFPEDLPRLPPDWELEFGIDLLLGSAPISIAPYRMTLVELKEFKT